jgi:hypothetical protein
MGSWGRRISARKLRAHVGSHQLGRDDLLRLFYAVLPENRPAWVDDRVSLSADVAELCAVVADSMTQLEVPPVRLVAAWQKQLGGEPPTLASLTEADPRLRFGLPSVLVLIAAAAAVLVLHRAWPKRPTLRLDPLVAEDLLPALTPAARAALRTGLREDLPLMVEAPTTSPTATELEARCIAEPMGRLGAERTALVEDFSWGQRLTCHARMRHRPGTAPVELPALAVLRPLPLPEVSAVEGGGCTATLPPDEGWRSADAPTVRWQWRRAGDRPTAWRDVPLDKLEDSTQSPRPPLPGSWECRAALVDQFTVQRHGRAAVSFGEPVNTERPLRVWVGARPRLRTGSPPPPCPQEALPSCSPDQPPGDHPLETALRSCAASLAHPLPITFVAEPARADVTITATIFGQRRGDYFELRQMGALVEQRGSENTRRCAILQAPQVELARYEPDKHTIDDGAHQTSRFLIARELSGAQLPRLVASLAPGTSQGNQP